MSIIWVWLQFVGLAAIIGFAGYHLSYYADAIAERTGLGRNWVGIVLLATVTSLPELMSGISAVRFADSPNLAVGDILGSCIFNLTLVFLLDVIHREGSIYSRATQGHALTGALGIILISFVGFAILVSDRFIEFDFHHVGGFSLAIPIFYLLSMRVLYSFERRQKKEPTKEDVQGGSPYAFFILAAIVVVAAGAALPFVGQEIIEQMGWNAAFVGTIFMAFATSLPEIAVTIAAVRLRAIELAFSNVLGSNLFNVVILFIDDLFYTKGPLLQNVTAAHSVTAFSAVMMTGLVLVALVETPKQRILNTVSTLSALLLMIFLLNAYIVFKMGI